MFPLFGVNGIAYGAFVAELMLAVISTVILARIMKGLLENASKVAGQ